MPVEILELVIKAHITNNNDSEGGAANPVQETANTSEDAQQEVVERVMDILKRKNER